MSSDRTTRAQLDTIFGRFVSAIGGRIATDYTDIGGLRLDCRGRSRRCNVVQYREHGGESEPFGARLRTYGELWHALDFAIQATAYRPERFS